MRVKIRVYLQERTLCFCGDLYMFPLYVYPTLFVIHKWLFGGQVVKVLDYKPRDPNYSNRYFSPS